MTDPNAPFFWDAYLHWANFLDAIEDGPFSIVADTTPDLQLFAISNPQANQTPSPPPQRRLYEVLFVRVRDITADARNVLNDMYKTAGNMDQQTVLEALNLQFMIEPQDGRRTFLFDELELLIGLEHYLKCDQPFEFFLYRLRAGTQTEHDAFNKFLEIIDVGPTALLEQAIPSRGDIGFDPNPGKKGLTIGAVIDNDIGFLNTAFQHQNGDTRIDSIWLQSRRRNTDIKAPFGQDVFAGLELDKAAIDRLAKAHAGAEATAYRDLNSALHLWERFQNAPLGDTHGTAVAALAFGNDTYASDASVLDYPLLGVQVPPEAAADTTGTYSESYIVQGVRWLCWKARQISSEAKLVINISYGTLAGPKDGSKFIEEQIEREVASCKKLGLTVHVVYAFGNGLNTKQVAQFHVPDGGKAVAPRWVIPRGQRLPNFMEIRAVDPNDGKLVQVPEDLAFTLTDPHGIAIDFDLASGKTTAPPWTNLNEPASARFFYVPDRCFDDPDRPKATGMVQIAIAPTLPLLTEYPTPVAPNGDWDLMVKNNSKSDIKLVLQIQRGDIAPGFSIGGQQSFFEGEYTEGPSGDFPTTDVMPPLTNDGTHSAYVTAQHPNIHKIGAMRMLLDEAKPADYAARGAAWSVELDLQTAVEVVDGIFSQGRPVTGTYSGSRTRLSGSSAAAALRSRKLT
jgi:hypothetical protein